MIIHIEEILPWFCCNCLCNFHNTHPNKLTLRATDKKGAETTYTATLKTDLQIAGLKTTLQMTFFL